jgi:pyruvate dehydrogenase E2 component (dihydrolipoamide acetyltransferase)
MPTQVKLPNLGENIESGDVLTILVSEGDTVKADQDLMEIETDKATMPIPSPEAGKVVKLLVSEGDTVKIGAPILELEPAGAAEEKKSEKEAKADEKETEQPAKPKPKTKTVAAEEEEEEAEAEAEEDAERGPAEEEPQKPRKKSKREDGIDEDAVGTTSPTVPARMTGPGVATDDEGDFPGDGHAAAAAGPSVRRLARQLGVDLRRVRPSGEGGRITADDVQAYVRHANAQAKAAAPRSVTPPGKPDTDDHGAVRRKKMSRLRQTIARNMLQSYTTIPQLTNFDDVDVTELEHMREQSKADYAARGMQLTQMPFLIKAVASALRLHPIVNASVDMEHNQVIYREYVNIGIAVDTEKGLIVPVMRDVDRLSMAQIARELARLAAMAREGNFTIEDLRGGTFTISNLGAVGGTYSTPIINPPEVAILLVGRSRKLPMYVNGHLEPRLMMPLSITYDHRAVDGAAAARFLNEVKGFLSAPGRLLLAP